jgi:4-amino-4-deoxy-L-arabinose transferase-like glycosyltransferase
MTLRRTNDAIPGSEAAPIESRTASRLRTAVSAVSSEAALTAAVLFAAAFLVRLVAAQLVRPDPTRASMFDASFNFAIARDLFHGNGFTVSGMPTAHMPPGYAASLAGVFFVSGPSLESALFANAALGALSCALTYAAARQLFDHTAGIVAGAIVVVLPSHVLLSTLLLSENLGTPLLLATVLLSFRVLTRGGSAALGLALGAMIGFGVLSRGEVGVALAALLVVLAASRTPRPRVRPWLLPAFLSTSVVVGAWVARNEIQMGIPEVTGSATTSMYSALGPPYFSFFNLADVAIAREGNPPLAPEDREAYASRAEVRQIIRYAQTHPGEELRRIPSRFWGYAGNDRGALRWIASDPGALSHQDSDRLSLICDAFYFSLLCAALLTLPVVLMVRDMRHVMLLLVIVGWSALHTFVFTGEAHYHIPILPLVAIIAAGGCVTCWRQVRDKIGRQAPSPGTA